MDPSPPSESKALPLQQFSPPFDSKALSLHHPSLKTHLFQLNPKPFPTKDITSLCYQKVKGKCFMCEHEYMQKAHLVKKAFFIFA